MSALDIVQLDFCHVGDPPFRELVVSVLRLDRDGNPDDAPLMTGTVVTIGAWLKHHGYDYVPATRGVWVRP